MYVLLFRWYNWIWRFWDINLDNILIDEKWCKNILVYNISYKFLIWAKPLPIKFDKSNGFIIVYDRFSYLALFGVEKYHFIYNKITFLKGVKSGIADVISYYYAKLEVDLSYSLSLEKTLTFHNFMILIKSVFNKDWSDYYNIFLEKGSNELSKNKNNIQFFFL